MVLTQKTNMGIQASEFLVALDLVALVIVYLCHSLFCLLAACRPYRF
jgi:hypothetical protein